MTRSHDEGALYPLAHVVLMSGLTERTVRSHIARGFLCGEKINGLWHFTPEQIRTFLCHPAVRPGVLAKHHAAVYDFLLDAKKSSAQSCTILDLPGYPADVISDFFCRASQEIQGGNFCFFFDGIANTPRVILRGDARLIASLTARFFDTHAQSAANAPSSASQPEMPL